MTQLTLNEPQERILSPYKKLVGRTSPANMNDLMNDSSCMSSLAILSMFEIPHDKTQENGLALTINYQTLHSKASLAVIDLNHSHPITMPL